MTVAPWLPLLVKASVTALLVVSASATAEALGPFWGALVATVPVSTGPAYVFLAVQHGAEFVAASALSSLAANAAAGLFLMAHGVLARSASPWRSLGAAVLLNLVTYGAGFALFGVARRAGPEPAPPARQRPFDLPFRAVLVAVFVSLIVATGGALGPRATGIAAVFPIGLISLFAIVRPRIGGPASALLAAHAPRPMLGFGAMLLVLHLAVRPWGVVAALLLLKRWERGGLPPLADA